MKKKAYEHIVEVIGEMIESGDLSEGDRLPPERDLAQKFQVSRNTVREAIKTLAEKKVLYSIVGSGTFVAESAVDILRSSISDTLEAKKHRLNDIFELRQILEPQIAALAAKRIRPPVLDKLNDLVNAQAQAVDLGQSPREHDKAFHRTLAKATGNTILFHMYEKLQAIFDESRTEDLQSADRKEVSVNVHKEILEALFDGDSVKARQKMTKHMRQIQRTLEKPADQSVPARTKTQKRS